jgi:hypothetical protein
MVGGAAGDPEGGIDVPLHRLVEGVIGQVHQRLQIARAARVVHQNVNRAEMLDGVIDEAFEVGLVHHIACADFLKHFRAFVRIAREQGDAGALG